MVDKRITYLLNDYVEIEKMCKCVKRYIKVYEVR